MATSRLESGTLRPAKEVLALAPRVRRAWDALGAPRTCRSSSSDEAAGWLAIADPDQLDQVLWALLDNAARYAGGAAIRARVAPRPEDGQLAVTIADGGPGVRPEDRDRIFERYERGAAGASVEGTGLGLYVSRSLCQAMGGDLVLEPAGSGRRAPRSPSCCPGSRRRPSRDRALTRRLPDRTRGSTKGCCGPEPMAR